MSQRDDMARGHVAMLAGTITAGAAVDTWLFLSWSGFGFTWSAFWGQVLVKALLVSPIAVAVLAVLDRRRRVTA